jgi:hypothetical protein
MTSGQEYLMKISPTKFIKKDFAHNYLMGVKNSSKAKKNYSTIWNCFTVAPTSRNF